VPLGIAGPLVVHGEHAEGEFLIPLATTEGTLVASYNRGIDVINRSGGVTCTVSADRMQRAPVFIFDSAREARDFATWVQSRIEDLRRVAEATTHVGRLQRIESYLAHRFAFLRFDYTTGDAAGQNMVGKATMAECQWLVANGAVVRHFFLDSHFGSDKKVSYINSLRTRGKRVTAEVTIPRATRPDPPSFSLANTKIVSPAAICLPAYIVFCPLNSHVFALGSITSALIANVALLMQHA